MKKELWKKENLIYIGMFILLVFVHFPIFTKTLLTADVLLNNSFYNGYAWEISLGRFGLWVIGVLKGYVSIPIVDFFVSSLFILATTYLLIKLFKVDNKVSRVLAILLMVLSPVVSATLLFHYCSIAYFLAFFSGVFSIYSYYKFKKKIFQLGIPVICIVISLSMYQAYLSLIVTTFILYQIYLLLHKKMDYKKSGIYILLLLLGIIIYFILMKLSLIVFHIDMASYSNANSIGLSTLLSFPQKFVDSYKLFFEFFFTNSIMKNTYLGNRVLHATILIFFLITYGFNVVKSRCSVKEKVLLGFLILLMPVFLNSVIFVISDSKLQLLMSASYLVFLFFVLTFSYEKVMKVLLCLSLVCLFRNYLIQDQASYATLEETYHAYDTIISKAIKGNDSNKKYIVIGEITAKKSTFYKKNYGYVVDDGIFWDEYNLRKLGFERFCKQAYGMDVQFGEEELYKEVKENPLKKDIYEQEDTIVINLYNV